MRVLFVSLVLFCSSFGILFSQEGNCKIVEYGIGDISILKSAKNILKYFGEIKNTYDNYSEMYCLSNKDNSQYMLLHQYLGSEKYSIDRVKIGVIKKNKWKYSWTNFLRFKTSMGISLGISTKDLFEIFQNKVKFKRKSFGYERVCYFYDCEYELYFAKYLFEKDVLIEIEFGFLTR